MLMLALLSTLSLATRSGNLQQAALRGRLLRKRPRWSACPSQNQCMLMYWPNASSTTEHNHSQSARPRYSQHGHVPVCSVERTVPIETLNQNNLSVCKSHAGNKRGNKAQPVMRGHHP